MDTDRDMPTCILSFLKSLTVLQYLKVPTSVSMEISEQQDRLIFAQPITLTITLIKMEGGMFNTARATTVLKIPTPGKHQSAYIAGQYSHSDGPFESPQGFNRGNIFGKFHTHITPQE